MVPIQRRQQPQSTATTAEFSGFAPEPQRGAADRAFVGTLSAIAALLASRILLLLAVVGAFVLALRASGDFGLYILISYSVLTVLPLVALDIVTRQRGGV